MQVDTKLLRSVVFVCEGRAGQPIPIPIGTAFLLSPSPLPGSKRRWAYAVTAAHLIDDIENDDETDGQVWIRFNELDGKLTTFATKPSDWKQHPDRGADVAVYRWPLKHVGEHIVWSMDVQLIDDLIQKYQIGPGDDVFIVGLFSKAEGKTRNIPIVRVGNIAAMPEEPIYLQRRDALAKVFLIESRSIGGLSGSPVFVHLGHMRLFADGADKPPLPFTFKGLPKYWMGMIHGHYDVGLKEGPVNMGIAVVTPHERIVDVINSPEEVRFRVEMDKDLDKRDEAKEGNTECP